MKRIFKQTVRPGMSILLILLLLLSVLPTAIASPLLEPEDKLEVEYFGLGGARPDFEIPPQPAHQVGRPSIPSSYDGRDVDGNNYQSPVKNQRRSDTCWVFGTNAAIEASAIKNGFSSQGEDAIDISEYHAATALSKGNGNLLGFNRNINDGGTTSMIVAYIARNELKGLVSEADDPNTFGEVLFSSNLGKFDERDPALTG